jgi:hypothetical protein
VIARLTICCHSIPARGPSSSASTENLTSLLAQLATFNPPEIARMASIGLGGDALIEVRELVATLLDPR